jgi:hypothetical protein
MAIIVPESETTGGKIMSDRKTRQTLSEGIAPHEMNLNDETTWFGDAAGILAATHSQAGVNGGDDGTRTRGLCRDRAAF